MCREFVEKLKRNKITILYDVFGLDVDIFGDFEDGKNIFDV